MEQKRQSHKKNLKQILKQRWDTIKDYVSKRRKQIAALSAAVGSFIALIPVWYDRLTDTHSLGFNQWPLGWRIILAAIAFLLAAFAVGLYWKDLDSISKHRKEQIDERLSMSTFLALQDANRNKTDEIMRYTYGQVHKWSHINYYTNMLMYDIHDQIRQILNSLRDLIINYDEAGRFNKDNVVVDLLYSYEDFCFGELYDPDIKESIRLISSGDNDCGPVVKELLYDNESQTFYKLLIDGISEDDGNNKDSGTSCSTQKQRSYDRSEGYLFFNDKMRSVFNNTLQPYSPTTKDKIYSNIANGGIRDDKKDYPVTGSIIGLVFYVKNDQPNQVGIKAVLTINTYGHRIIDNNEIDENAFEEGFYQKVLCSYRSLLVSELSQLYIRHQVKQGVRNPFKGEVLTSFERMQDEVSDAREKFENAKKKNENVDDFKKAWEKARKKRIRVIKDLSKNSEEKLTALGKEYEKVLEENEKKLSAEYPKKE